MLNPIKHNKRLWFHLTLQDWAQKSKRNWYFWNSKLSKKKKSFFIFSKRPEWTGNKKTEGRDWKFIYSRLFKQTRSFGKQSDKKWNKATFKRGEEEYKQLKSRQSKQDSKEPINERGAKHQLPAGSEWGNPTLLQLDWKGIEWLNSDSKRGQDGKFVLRHPHLNRKRG